MAISAKDVTIIIPHLGETGEQRFAFDVCCRSIKKTVGWRSKIVVVYNNQLDDEWRVEKDSIILAEQGQCKAVNAAAATVNTPWIFVTNDDMIYAPGWFEKLTGMTTEFDFPCLSPTLVEPQDGAPPFIKHFCGGAGGDFDMQCWLDFNLKYQLETGGYCSQGFNLPFLIKKDLWDMIGGYDINYDPWGSNGDSDLQAKIYLAGAKTWRNRNAIVYHFSQTSGTFHPDHRDHWQKNWDYFIEKWGFPRQGDDHKIWYSQALIDYEKLKYHPWWEGKYGED